MTTLTEFIPFSFALAFLTFLWFNTTFVLEYGSLLGLAKFLKKQEWEEYFQESNGNAKYPYFLRTFHSSFITRLLGCPYCLMTFVSLVGCVGYSLGNWSGIFDLLVRLLDVAGEASLIHLGFIGLHKKVYNEK